jgi:hypothetical protein
MMPSPSLKKSVVEDCNRDCMSNGAISFGHHAMSSFAGGTANFRMLDCICRYADMQTPLHNGEA